MYKMSSSSPAAPAAVGGAGAPAAAANGRFVGFKKGKPVTMVVRIGREMPPTTLSGVWGEDTTDGWALASFGGNRDMVISTSVIDLERIGPDEKSKLLREGLMHIYRRLITAKELIDNFPTNEEEIVDVLDTEFPDNPDDMFIVEIRRRVLESIAKDLRPVPMTNTRRTHRKSRKSRRTHRKSRKSRR